MTAERKAVLLRRLQMIADDAAQDPIDNDGKPMTGRVLGEYFGGICAEINSLALTIKEMLENME